MDEDSRNKTITTSVTGNGVSKPPAKRNSQARREQNRVASRTYRTSTIVRNPF
jgi:hypothetical protein